MTTSSMRLLLLCLATIFSVTTAFCNHTLTDVIKFATADKARTLLTQEDEFTDAWSQFDIDSRLQKKGGTKTELLAFIETQAREWTAEEERRIRSLVTSIDSQMMREGFTLDLPDELYFVKTTANEEGGAGGYTRANYIVLKEDMMSNPDARLKQIIVHELFHVLTRKNAAFRKEMYGIIGFTIVNSVPYPDSLKDLRITNPDAPRTDAMIKLKVNDEDVECMMITYANRSYDGGSFFKYLNAGFARLTGDPVKEVALRGGAPVLYTMKEVSLFFEQVGNNTRYIIHPEEILADNFAYTVLGRSSLPNPEIVDAIRKVLKMKRD